MKKMTTEEFIAAWNAGKTVRVVEMGGLGYWYEQCIWHGAVAILKDLLLRKPTFQKGAILTDKEKSALDSALHIAIGKSPEMEGMSGAQAGAAKNAALMIYVNGYEDALDMAPKDRIIEISTAIKKDKK